MVTSIEKERLSERRSTGSSLAYCLFRDGLKEAQDYGLLCFAAERAKTRVAFIDPPEGFPV